MNLFFLAVLFAAAEPFTLVSWNVQTFGRVKPQRLALCAEAYKTVVSSDVWVLAVQEIANEKGSELFVAQLPPAAWQSSFQDTSDPMDNALYFKGDHASAPRRGFVFADPVTGRPDRSKLLHPARWAHVRAGDFDFTLVSVHLTYKSGDKDQTRKELRSLLAWTTGYLADAVNDPDLVVAGDFNLSAEEIEEELPPGSKLRVLVREPSSVGGHSFDHFIVSDDVQEELLDADLVPHPLERVSDHLPIYARFRSSGPGVAPDFRIVSATRAAATSRASTGR